MCATVPGALIGALRLPKPPPIPEPPDPEPPPVPDRPWPEPPPVPPIPEPPPPAPDFAVSTRQRRSHAGKCR